MRGKTKTIKNYTIFLKQLLGEGNYGKVYKGENSITKQQCAIKVIQKKIINNDYLKNSLWTEIQVLTKVKSENIIQCIDVLQSQNSYYIIQQLCNSDLEHLMKENPKISQEVAIDLLMQIINGFTVLVMQGIIHRDLKPANILLKDEIIKIADFGMAKENTSQKMRNQSFIGTPLYMAPQILNGDPYSSKCDVWACGFIFYQLLHNKSPWYGATRRALLQDFQNTPLKIKAGLKPQTVNFLKKTLQIDEQKRLSWDQVFSHSIFHGFFDYLSSNNDLIEDKLKMFMNCLRNEVNRKNIDIYMLIKELSLKQELKLQDFRRFIRIISADVTDCQIRGIFDQLASNSHGTITVSTIQKKMQQYNVEMNRSGLKKQIKEQQTLTQKLFKQLYNALKQNDTKLRDIFFFHSKENSYIDFEKFRKMMSRFDYNRDELLQIFEEIDAKNVNVIEYDDLNLVFCLVNFIPMEALQQK